jgi:acetyl-CoA carboxylase carboxyl transferase subunit alpha
VGDVVAMLQHAYYSVITPEGCASILWRDASMKERAAEALKLTSEELLRLELIDTIIPEPLGGAHHDPAAACANVKEFLLAQWASLRQVELPFLVEQRYLKFRKMGRFASL